MTFAVIWYYAKKKTEFNWICSPENSRSDAPCSFNILYFSEIIMVFDSVARNKIVVF